MEYNDRFWEDNMRIKAIDDYSVNLGELTVNLDDILMQAEQSQGDVFDCAISLIKHLVADRFTGTVRDSKTDLEIKRVLKEFVSLGRTSRELTISIEPLKGGTLNVNFDANVFEEVIQLPQTAVQQRYQRLVGLDELKNKIRKEASVWLAPEALEKWSHRHHSKVIHALSIFRDRYPFFIFEGDVGTGKTEFAETFGDDIARSIQKQVLLARVSMKSRGNGVVGEMSKLISKVFADASSLAEKYKTPVILLLDEADSLAQSREENQMHHEDRAGVNALIQGIDKVRNSQYPVMVVFCTNRVQSLDPAIKRRAAMIHNFVRPNGVQRIHVFEKYLKDLGIQDKEIEHLAEITGDVDGRNFGFTYSDLVTRLIPEVVLSAFPDQKVTFNIVMDTVGRIQATPPFRESK
ncbi:Proteasome-associated ATPase [Paenibacillus solanacearum]|uniref:Proteasome-associated ATPase n=1 Tax=Paenibacillus solanacearum TaxID=2048548 RepID=A0A916K8E4_9BACL|nr:AAA family ATPase [Paenibacillus solanacearum]CAG7653145.1 Proteasome-associated ATPase [Paenibacillus solanacearum]